MYYTVGVHTYNTLSQCVKLTLVILLHRLVQPPGVDEGEGAQQEDNPPITTTQSRGKHSNGEETGNRPWTLLDVLTSPTEREFFKVGEDVLK